MATPPSFFYNPNAYALGLIREESIVCRCCGRAREYAYHGSFFSARPRSETRPLCPWCIADGRAAAQFESCFVADFEGIDPDPRVVSRNAPSAASAEQVSARTPGYLSWQEPQWLTHCGEACVFLGYAGQAELQPIWAEIHPDIVASGWDEQLVRQSLSQDGDLVGYLFQCQHCGQHRLHIDAS